MSEPSRCSAAARLRDIYVARNDAVEMLRQFGRYLARSSGHIRCQLGHAIVGLVVVVYELVEWLVIMRTGCKVFIPILFALIGTLEDVGGIFARSHISNGLVGS